MHVRVFQPETDYAVIESWWAARSLPHVPRDILPAHGAVASAGVDVAMGFCYFDTGGKIGVVDFVSTNPSVGASSTTLEAIAHLMGYFEEVAVRRGCPNLMSFVAHNTGLHRLMVKSGWMDPQAAPHVYLLKKVA